MTTGAQTNRDKAVSPFKVEQVQSWRATLRRAAAWKTARYTKGDIEATVVGITDELGKTGYGYMTVEQYYQLEAHTEERQESVRIPAVEAANRLLK